MKNLISVLATVTLVCTFLFINAQTSQNYDLGAKIEEMVVMPGGILIVGTSEGLMGIEAHKGGIQYKYSELGKIKAEEIEILPGTPWVLLHQGQFGNKSVINYLSGEPIFEGKKSGWNAIVNHFYDPSTGQIIVLGNNSGNKPSLGVYDLTQKKEVGVIGIGKKEIGGTPMLNIKSHVHFVGDYVFIVTPGGLACIHWKTPEVKWVQKEIDDISLLYKVYQDPSNADWYVTAQESGKFKTRVYRLTSGGELVWKKPVKFDAEITSLDFEETGIMVSMFDAKNTGFNFIDKETGTKQWKKDYEMKGRIYSIIRKGENYIVAGGEGVEIVNNKGKEIKKLRTGSDFKLFVETGEGILYIAGTSMGLIDPETFEFKKEPAKFKKVEKMVLAVNPDNDQLYMSTGNELFAIEKNGQSRKISDINFKEGEFPSNIEFLPEGILLTSSQNALLVDNEGKPKYQVYYKSPGQSAGMAILAGAMMAATATMAVGTAASAGYKQGLANAYAGNSSTWGAASDMRSQARSEGAISQDMAKLSGAFASEMTKRFKASATTRQHLFILTKTDNGIALVRVNKSTGEKDKEIVINDRKPVYKVDEDFGVLYYKSDNKSLLAYDLR